MGLIWGMLVMAAPGLAQEIGSAEKASAVDISELATQSKKAPAARRFAAGHKRFQTEPQNLPVSKTTRPEQRAKLATQQSIATIEPQTLAQVSPAPSSSFAALEDNGEVAPPDTSGAVGPQHLVIACASELRIMTRAGAVLETTSQERFWSGVASNIFDTRVVYDPYGQRFIMTAAGDPAGANPRLCIAVSSSSDPTGSWYRWSEDVDATSPIYADSPAVGFNKTWIVVQANLYNKTTFEFVRSDVYAYNKANLYANGTGQRTRLGFSSSLGGSQTPATMYDPTIAVVYFVKNWNGRVEDGSGGAHGFLRLFSLSGGIGSERLNVTNSLGEEVFAEIGASWAETSPGDIDILPQLRSTSKIYAGDSRIQNVHFRDGLVYCAHTVFLPGAAPTHAAAQWWGIAANSGEVIHFGRVHDPTGTNMFAYPTIAANRYHDLLLGYSRFSPNEYPSVAYSFRRDTDAIDELRGEVVLKAGDTNYNVPIFGQNRWGDWSATMVDGGNDVDLWTIQEYAAAHEPASGDSRWGTWWGRVSPPGDLAITSTDAPDPVPSGNQVTYTLRVTNKLEQIVSAIRIQDILPPGSTYVSSTTTKGTCGHSDGVLNCSMGQLTEFESVTITLTVNAGPPGSATNIAMISANGPDVFPSDNTAISVTDVINSADLQVQGTDSPDPVHVGNMLTYTLSISNRGPTPAAGVVMTSTLPASVTIGTISGQATWSINGNEIAFTFGSINNQGTAQVTISCTPNVGGGMITNQIRVAANTFDPTQANNSVNVATRVNARPVITQIGTQRINEDMPTSIPITISDAETAAGSLQLSAVSSNQGLIPNANIDPGGTGQNRTLTVSSALNQFGSNTTTITVTVTDTDGASSTMSFPINVAAVNDAPTIANIPNPPAINEDTSTSVTVNIGDIDSPLSALSLSANSSAPGLLPVGNISFSPSGSSRVVTLTPAANRSGTANVTIIVSDGSLSASNSFALTVSPVNDAPTISSINPQTTSEDTASPTITFTVGDLETAATDLTVTATSSDTAVVPNANLALANLGSSRTIRATPAANQNGTVSITVRVSDGTNSQTTAFDLTITEVNDRPTLTDPSNLTTNEDAGVISVALAGIGSGAANENQTLSVRASTSTPDLVENLEVNYTSPNNTGTLTFNLVTNASGTAVIDVTVSDGNGADDFTRQFDVVITAVNDPPTIDPITNVTVEEDSGQESIVLTGITSGDPSEINQTNVITATSSAPGIIPNPQISHVPGASTATLRFIPVANANGSANITVTVDDGRANGTSTRTFQITVTEVNDSPTMGPHLGDRTINEDASAGPIAFHFRDVELGMLTIAGTSSNPSLVPDSNVVITGTGTNRNMTITPLPNEFGTTFITVRVSDTEGGATNQTFRLNVSEVNDAPTLASIPNPPAIEEDASTQTVNLAGISPGPANESSQAVTIAATSSNPAIVPHPTVNYTTPASTGSLSYAPSLNATGSVIITVTVNDGQSANNVATRTFTVQINPVNDPPTISGDFEDKFSDEDVTLVLTGITVGDVENSAGSLTLRGSSSNPELVADTGITFSGTGATRTVNVRPLTNEFGSAFITITVTDGGGGETEAGFFLTVNEVDDPPMIAAPAGTQTISEDTPANVNFWVNDMDTALASLSVTGRSSNQQLVPDANISVLPGTGTNRTVRVTPVADAHGSANIILTVDDGNSNRTAQFTLTVNSINDPPVFDDIGTLNLVEDAGLQVITLTGVGPGAANESSDVLTVSAVSNMPGIIPHPVGTNESGALKLRFTPVPNASGAASITVTVSDGRPVNPTTSKSFMVNVQPVNDPPTLSNIADQNVGEDSPPQSIVLSGISPGPSESDALTFTATSSNPSLVSHPTVSHTNGNSTAVLRFTVAPNLIGSATITVRLSDGVNEITDTFSVAVTLVNDAPVFLTTVTDLTTPEDTPISAAFMVGDEETYAARLSLSATSTTTTLVPNANITFNGADSNRTVTIIPAANQFGTTRITITLSDGTNNVTSAFNLTVTSSNDPPTLNVLTNVTRTDGTVFPVNLSGIGAGGGESQTLAVRVTSSNTSLVPTPTVTYTSPNAAGSISINPANSGTGFSVITVTVWDNGSPSNSFSRSFTVYVRSSGNTVPTLTGVPANRSTAEDTPITIPFTVSDATTAAASLLVGALSSNPDLVPTNAIVFSGTDGNRSMTITPLPDRSGSSTITVWVLDTQFGYTASNMVLQVTGTNDAPIISSIAAQTIEPGTNMSPVAFTISDAETPAQNLTLTATSSNQGLLPNSGIVFGGSGNNRSVMAYPIAGQTGSATITITVTDGNSVSANTTFVFTVRPPEPPRLTIRRSGSEIELLWPTDASTYTVQGRDQLNAGNWADITATPTVSGTNYVVRQSLAGPGKFFRLRN
jgi:uncharacterized repeat protein (TIGR01451 family)